MGPGKRDWRPPASRKIRPERQKMTGGLRFAFRGAANLYAPPASAAGSTYAQPPDEPDLGRVKGWLPAQATVDAALADLILARKEASRKETNKNTKGQNGGASAEQWGG